ncbi:MAG: 3-demethylubiquinone-9 3-O-methyltransferase [Deltaproteobacteria bacterium]|nr:3-demethylubiquinone-9 3-O-methyltransferase [Deltaproteobacteria bacterium]
MLANQVQARLSYFDRIDPRWEGVTVLDLGCGGGFMAEALARRGARVLGVDPSMPSLAAARRHAEKSALDIRYIGGIGEAVPLLDRSVDRVVCVDVLEHVRDIGRVIREVRRVLRPGGLFLFDTINRNWLSRLAAVTIVEDVLCIIPKGTHDPEKFIKPSEMRAYLRDGGFQQVPAAFTGMGPVGIDRRADFVFGLLPVTWIMYLGHAR